MFESYLDRGKKRSLRSRALTLSLSVLLHGGGVGLLIFMSLFHVEELPEPSVTVTFFSVAPPPPPPPPPRAPAATKPKKKRRVRRPTPKPMDVQPPEKPPPPKKDKEPEPEPEPAAGQAEGVEGGVEGGVPGGVPRPGAKPKPKKKEEPKKPVYVRRQVVEKFKISGTMPQYLPAARMAKVQGVVIVRLCLKVDGTADMAATKILKGLDALNEEILSKVRTWRYKPYLIDGVATPVCFPVKFVFRFQ